MSIRLKIAFITFVMFLLPWIVVSCSGSGGGVDNDGPENSPPPASINDLQVTVVTVNSVALRWTAPGNDGHSGCASEYDLRVAYDSMTAQTFATAYRVQGVVAPLPAGAEQTTVVDSLQPDSTYYFALKTRDWEGNWSGISNCVSATCPADSVVTFPDTALERVVRQAINKPTGEIKRSDLSGIVTLQELDGNIYDLTGIEHCPSLVMMFMQGNHITDLALVAGLSRLQEVNFSRNNVSDLTPLAGLTELTHLELGTNPISDVAPLAGLTKMKTIRLQYTQIADYSPLYSMSFLEELGINNNGLDDIGFVSHFPHLKYLNITANQISSITTVTNLTSLECLWATFNQISDLSPLTNLVNLKEISLQYNQVSDITPLVNNPGLGAGDIVYIGHNSLSQYSIDSLIPKLEARGVTVYR